ncbi:SPOR domain-containing protein [Azonexus sp.]|jgi:DedD protein|uniref:SPOR domain-containing protein n=1 Tax=Azonexus sp. TaxID=1872668 RepID=UPI002821DA75|nr:SPOR domain-containing protein [Azonexus sp.]MDR1996459.1 SPOR domain-containing protein [Azonexus sp.]
MEDNDAQLQLEKRARRRLVGAVAFVSVVAMVLPMVMDHEPRQAMQDVEIRIPGQDEKPFAPRFAAEPVERPVPPARPAEAPAPAAKPDIQPNTRVLDVVRDKDDGKPAAKTPEKPTAKPVEKVPEKPAAKPADKPADKADDEARRAAAILAGQTGDASPAGNSGEYLVLIGAFASEANVQNLKTKLGELGIKVYSEPLDTPQGRKTRVRAGPFAGREAAEKALAKMQKIGVSGVVAPRQ